MTEEEIAAALGKGVTTPLDGDLLQRIAAAVVMEPCPGEVVSALLSAAAAYIRIAPAEYRVTLAEQAGQLLIADARHSLG